MAKRGHEMTERFFTQSQIEAIAAALGDTESGLTGSEIHHILGVCGIQDINPALTKRHRLHNALAASQNSRRDRRAILAFIRHSMKPERHLRDPERFEAMRANLNRALAFAALEIDATGSLKSASQAQTISEAERRAQNLRQDLIGRGAHPDVLRFCKAELLADNYFHAVLEAMKSVAEKIRVHTGLTEDGSILIDRALGGDLPLLAINTLQSESEKSEQRGFANLLRGCFSMFRNPTAHVAKIHWEIDREDAEDLLSIVSLIHRRLGVCILDKRNPLVEYWPTERTGHDRFNRSPLHRRESRPQTS